MGYLNNGIITVDAILTKKGRELLARGDGDFKITQFALSDDEIDYTLYNSSHPSGSAFYGEAIEALPTLEAFPDESQIMKYKLTTLPRGTARLPVISGINPIEIKQGATLSLTPETFNFLGKSSVFENRGYLATIADIRLLATFTGSGVSEEAESLERQTTLGTNVSKTVIGSTINIVGTTVNEIFGSQAKLTTTLTIIGRDSGARITVPLTIKKSN